MRRPNQLMRSGVAFLAGAGIAAAGIVTGVEGCKREWWDCSVSAEAAEAGFAPATREESTQIAELPPVPDYLKSLGRTGSNQLVGIELGELPPINSEIVDMVKKASIHVIHTEYDENGEPKYFGGSGGLVSPDGESVFAVTAGHVVELKGPVGSSGVRLTDGRSVPTGGTGIEYTYDGKQVRSNELPKGERNESDLAAIEVRMGIEDLQQRGAEVLNTRDLSESPVGAGETLWVSSGNPNDGFTRMYRVIVSESSLYANDTTRQDDPEFIDVFTNVDVFEEKDEAHPGDSGSIVVDDEGEVVGVIVSASLPNQSDAKKNNYCTRIEVLEFDKVLTSKVVITGTEEDCEEKLVTEAGTTATVQILGDNFLDLVGEESD